MQHWFWLILPSFVSRRFGHSTIKQTQPDETSYLNGLRGVAAVVVVLQHITEFFYPENHGCYGDGGPEPDHYIQLPYFKLLLMGSFSVTLFFVISGFALTFGPLRKIHAGNPEAAIASMPSSIFRRPIRLFLPILPVYAFSWVLIQAWFIWNLGTAGPIPRQENFLVEMYIGIKHWLIIDTTPYVVATYFPQGWTLYDEHMGSLLVFLCCLAFARTKVAVRMLGVSIVAIWHFYVDQWTSFLFLGGMLLADLRLATADRPPLKPTHERWKRFALIALLVVSLFFGSWPYTGDVAQCVGFQYFAGIGMPGMLPMRFWHSLASVTTLFALEGLPSTQRLFNSPMILYLGEISYSLYLIHWAVGYSWAEAVAAAVIAAGYEKFWACMASVAVTLTTGIWVADLFWRYSDIQCVKLARWIATKLGV
ncbi:acyltransferase 3 [Coniella lustricola]|uniref:Acyltransferase 3 n=1 Tax=Coniella lustricola TaxID=2025994 RepID=A0A2T3ALP2_9PEZI|nr:acyltransferase 3 [Coniella lustricola]